MRNGENELKTIEEINQAFPGFKAEFNKNKESAKNEMVGKWIPFHIHKFVDIPSIFSLIYQDIKINKVQYGYNKIQSNFVLDISLSWNHYYGSNGIGLRLISFDDGKNWQI